MKLRELETLLQPLQSFAEPKRALEQYATSAHLAARMLFTAESQFGDIDGKRVLDLGCGCAMLSIAAACMGADTVIGVDIDDDALALAKSNIATMDMEADEDEEPLVSLVHGDVTADTFRVPGDTDAERVKFDTVVSNPPFGTWVAGADAAFLERACSRAETAVYSLHKSSTRDFLKRRASALGFEGTVVAQMKFDLPRTMAHHKAKSVDIEVDMWRFERRAS